ncbi:hypothetical protein LTR62_001817 [Meristemomyces frigidus]|uniref:Zn(2)-C6 fungal-type domain-containing protein n=1 Tax=Meristemomyces frigidus TaxID=1508187 RepID=A0AAN7TK30_9PEZI|nr:hypothetical protein LTR62_001817 [Meristemomyces frigidus]
MSAAIDPALALDIMADTNGEQLPPVSQAVQQPPPTMQTMQPQHPDQYRALPAPPHMYAPPYPQPPMGAYPPPQPAPRQRTAIACRYCRRRKIRCSGFDQSEDGRCTNCQRFSQECVFTPVSAQTQAFVPAHTVWRGQNPPPNTQLYGAYGQPLPQHGGRDPYAQQQQQQQQQPPPPQGGQYPPPPQGYQQPPMYPPQQQGQPPNMQPMQGQPAGTKRPNDEPHTPTLPPPNPAEQGQRGSFGYPDQTGLIPGGASPASSSTSFHSIQPMSYYPPQPARASSHSSFSYDPSHASSSPHTLGLHSTPVQSSAMPYYGGPAASPGPATADVARQAVKINELVGPNSQQQQQNRATPAAMRREERTSTDTSMVQALRRGPM